jgi:hypothetical protein
MVQLHRLKNNTNKRLNFMYEKNFTQFILSSTFEESKY